MKVGMVCPYDWSFPGGVRSHILGLTEALRNQGHEVEIIAPATNDEPEIFAAGRTLGIPYNGSVARLCFSRSANSRLAARLARGDLELLHIHEPASPSVSLLALRQARVPVVATFHASAERSLAYRLARPALAPLMAKISRKIAVSEAARRLISTHFPGDYELIPNGITKDRWAGAAPAEELRTAGPFVLFVGRPEPRKGLNIVVQAVEKLRSRRRLRLVVVGPTGRDVPDWVTALGPVGEKELPGIYAAADVFCAPSLGGESFGIVLAEAMAAGVPVVCSDIPGYLLASAGAALHVPAGDVTATAEAIESVLSDPKLAEDLVSKGARRSTELDWGALMDDVTACYVGALKDFQ
jgi:phosphatidyl-myo-inositol alpha-mannosyltransferase